MKFNISQWWAFKFRTFPQQLDFVSSPWAIQDPVGCLAKHLADAMQEWNGPRRPSEWSMEDKDQAILTGRLRQPGNGVVFSNDHHYHQRNNQKKHLKDPQSWCLNVEWDYKTKWIHIFYPHKSTCPWFSWNSSTVFLPQTPNGSRIPSAPPSQIHCFWCDIDAVSWSQSFSQSGPLSFWQKMIL